jgi:hypothetical protein
MGMLAVLAAIASLAAWLFLRGWHQDSAEYLEALERSVEAAEKTEGDALLGVLAGLADMDASRQLRASFSAGFFQAVADRLVPIDFAVTDPSAGPINIRLEKLTMEFRDGFPRLAATGRATNARGEVGVVARGVFRSTLEADGVRVNLQCLGLAPTVKDMALPAWAATIADAEATRAANTALAGLTLRLPLASRFVIEPGQPEPIEQWVKTGNGRVLLRITPPSVSPIVRHLQPRAAFFSQSGLHICADVLTSAPVAAATEPAAKPGAGELAEMLRPWQLPAGTDFQLRAGRELILDTLREVNAWPAAGRTVSVQGVTEEGHLLDKTGGPPFGNGFGAWLEGPERLRATLVLDRLEAVWQSGLPGVSVVVRATAQGNVQVHVHGNAPRIEAPRLFGRKIGGGVKIGGGAGTSLGATLPAQSRQLTGALQWDAASGEFSLRILEPDALTFEVQIGGVPDELVNLFGAGFALPLPRDRPLYRFAVPKVIDQTVGVPLPREAGGGTRTFRLRAEGTNPSITEDGLGLSGRLNIE